MVRVHLVYSKEEHAELIQIKNQSGLNWEQFVIDAAKAWERWHNSDLE